MVVRDPTAIPMWIGVASEKAAGVHPVGRWLMAGRVQWKGDLERKVTTISGKVQVYIVGNTLINY